MINPKLKHFVRYLLIGLTSNAIAVLETLSCDAQGATKRHFLGMAREEFRGSMRLKQPGERRVISPLHGGIRIYGALVPRILTWGDVLLQGKSHGDISLERGAMYKINLWRVARKVKDPFCCSSGNHHFLCRAIAFGC